jgi:hypothetical protein
MGGKGFFVMRFLPSVLSCGSLALGGALVAGVILSVPASAQQPASTASTASRPASASTAASKAQKPVAAQAAKPAAASAASTAPQAATGPQLAGTFEKWNVYQAGVSSKKTCYALARPQKSEAPAGVKRDPGYFFVSTRPAENVRNEISFSVGFPVSDKAEPTALVGGRSFALVARGVNLWIKNPAEEKVFLEAIKAAKKDELIKIEATSAKGNRVADLYAASGFSAALKKVQATCP